MPKSFKESINEFKNVRSLCAIALLLALSVVINLVGTIYITNELKLTLGFLTLGLAGCLYGPIPAAVIATATDIIVYAMHPTGPFSFGFTFSSLLTGLVFGLFLYKEKAKLPRIIISKSIINVFINTVLNSIWLKILYGKAFWALLPTRAIKNVILLPLEILLLWLLLPMTIKLLKKAQK